MTISSTDDTLAGTGRWAGEGLESIFNSIVSSPFGSALKSTFNATADFLGGGVDALTGLYSTVLPDDVAKVFASVTALGIGAYLMNGTGLMGLAMFGLIVAGIMNSSDHIKPDSPMGRMGSFMFGPYQDLYTKYAGGRPDMLPRHTMPEVA